MLDTDELARELETAGRLLGAAELVIAAEELLGAMELVVATDELLRGTELGVTEIATLDGALLERGCSIEPEHLTLVPAGKFAVRPKEVLALVPRLPFQEALVSL
jgi:hypothetical protein